jgi:hypothetical protein
MTHRAELGRRVDHLLDRVEPLHTISALGFRIEDEGVRDQSFGVLAGSPRYRFCDLRGLSEEAVRNALRDSWSAPVLVLAATARAVPEALFRLVRGFVDDQQEIELGDFQPVKRRDDQTVILVLEGATDISEVPTGLHRIPYWRLD